MRRAAVALIGVVLLSGCSEVVAGSASPAPTTAPAGAPAPTPAATATQSRPDCLIGDTCGDDPVVVAATGPDCSSLPAAVASFEAMAFGGDPAPPSTPTEEDAVRQAVWSVVDTCGYQAMVDVAQQYGDPLFMQLITDADTALGEIVSLPPGLLCRDLQAIGLSAKNAVDYWSYWVRPPNMDADLNGVPCETVWPDAGRYLPPWA